MINLAAGHCVACRGDVPSLGESEISELRIHVSQWEIITQDGVLRLQRVFKLKDFLEAVNFANKIAVISEEQGHHPLMITEWGRVTVQWWTHKVRGLHRNDFIMAAKTDELLGRSSTALE